MKYDRLARHNGDMGARQGKQVSRSNKTYDKNLYWSFFWQKKKSLGFL